ncbi:MAG TPA: aspartate kinase [Prolixibacteraceae bacterium]|nr:aspartate kinase [Bacteroidales bacterium]HCB61454.1 aspartate kinase [Bacteroidales bacterium]HCY43203.1 aspartate kinase [Prolixibacteraceae bacterium]
MQSAIRVFKFGGASVKDAAAVRNVASILKKYDNQNLVVILSAMGKTTNALERVHQAYVSGQKSDALKRISESKDFHQSILNDLFKKDHVVYNSISSVFSELEGELNLSPEASFDKSYDRIVSYGERIATTVLNAYLIESGFKVKHVTAGDFISTDNTYRDAYVNWEVTGARIFEAGKLWFAETGIVLTQGFIGRSEEGCPISLGREGSDFSASIFAHALNAAEVIIWKDVPGIMNADPKLIPTAIALPHISYREAVELAYYGASVIHPKTIKPLENKNIPLSVKSFINPAGQGTIIDRNGTDDKLVPSYIFKFNQVLLSILPRDFSFINEKNMSEIFTMFSRNNVKVRLMQNSAVSFSVCFDYEPAKMSVLIEDLQKRFAVRYNDSVDLVTIRHYTNASADEFTTGRKVLLEQKSRSTWQLIISKN